MKHFSLLLLVFAISCGKNNDSKQNQPESSDSAVQDDSKTGGNNNSQQPGGNQTDTGGDDDQTNKDDNTAETPTNQFKLDASSTSAAVYFTLEKGALQVTTSDKPWLFNVKRTSFQTNSGTSGTANIGVFETASTDYASVTNCAAGTLTFDEMLPASGAPGSQPYSGNAKLNAWYNYDMVTHTVSSKKLVYLVSNGTSCFKFQILSYEGGVYQVLADALEIPAPPAPVDPSQAVDASSSSVAVYLKTVDGKLSASAADQAWELNVKRTSWQSNSGTSGSGGFAVADTGSTDYASVTSCVAATFTADAMLPASGAPGSQPYSGNAVLNAWYNYDMATHVVSSKKAVYLISNGTVCYKLQILSYASGAYKILTDSVAIPPPVDPSQTIDASSSAAAVYLKTVDGKLSASAADQAWEINVKRTTWQTNSGTSGSGGFAVADTGSTDYESVTRCVASTFKADEMLPASGAPGSQPYSGSSILNAWYNYDMTTHAVSSKKLVYLISDGTVCYKLQILSYAAGVYKVLTDAVEIPAVYDQTVDASSTLNTVYFKIADGKLESTTVDDGSWLLAVKRTQFQTNTGSSATGTPAATAGVYNSAQTDFAAVTGCSGLTFTADAMLPASGAPGSQPYSGSASLNAWYNYDMSTHTVSSKQEVYAISDGSQCLKFQILTYTSGVYTVKVSLL